MFGHQYDFCVQYASQGLTLVLLLEFSCKMALYKCCLPCKQRRIVLHDWDKDALIELMIRRGKQAPTGLEVKSTCATVANQYKLESGYSFGSGLPGQSLQHYKMKVINLRHQGCIRQGLK